MSEGDRTGGAGSAPAQRTGGATEGELRFAFGRNWRRFVERSFSRERVEITKAHLLGFLGLENLRGRTFLDVGCGSGLHSLAAWEAGASEVVSFDYDEQSVAATSILHRRAGSPGNWRVLRGSVLDEGFMRGLPHADVVYSWGVLHHTGDQWTALGNTAARVAPGGLLYVALYTSDVFVDPPPEFWLGVKQRYVRGGALTRAWLVAWYVWRFDLGGFGRHLPRRALELARRIRDYRQSRGMSYLVNVRDWVGGWPMEFSAIADVKRFAAERCALVLEDIRTGEANTEYLFRRPAGDA